MNTKEVSKYLRSAILVGNSNKVDLNMSVELSYNNIINRNVDKKIANHIHSLKSDEEANMKSNESNVILVFNVIKAEYDMSDAKTTKKPTMEGILHVPALLKGCTLHIPSDISIPWIPLDLLITNEYDVTIGDFEVLDRFLSENSERLEMIFESATEDQWNNYIEFAKDIYNAILDETLLDDNYKVYAEYYMVKDDTISATFNISELYNDIINNNIENKLYKNFVTLKSDCKKKSLSKNVSRHFGNMNKIYELSPSQRECINATAELGHGDILAVSGPPGTGKTTLLQSVISNMLVQNAIAQSPPPIIVATSTNNKAVTNVIESFSRDNASKDLLEERWITNVDSYATFFPSTKKFELLEYEGYQKTNVKAKGFISEVESSKNRELSKMVFKSKYKEFFARDDNNLRDCKKVIHKALLIVNTIQGTLIEFGLLSKNMNYNALTIKGCIDNLNIRLSNVSYEIEYSKMRLNDWNFMYSKISIFYKFFALLGMKKYKNRISGLISGFCNNDENFHEQNIDDIAAYYCNKLVKLENDKANIEYEIKKCKEYKARINVMFEELIDISSNFSDYIDLSSDVKMVESNKMDITYRYLAFLLAVKYYEVSWLLLNEIDSDLIEKVSFDHLSKKLDHLSYLTPCFVSTAYMLPGIFKSYVGKKDGNWITRYLYEKIDMLIVDEAGQISPEILACSFALANKAVVVGDVNQIAPVYKINAILDKHLAIKAMSDETFNIGNYTINSSESSVMKVAENRSVFFENFMLKEHRRCYDSIINFNNELIYEGKLTPLRGNNKEADKLPLPYMGHVNIECEKAERVLTSRRNIVEAREIVRWLEDNYALITDNGAKSIGIIAPFKAQAVLINKLINKSYLRSHINGNLIGTVHTFQGDEKDIIIFSTTYGSNDTCSFLDSNRSILNVAVSRAKDHFLVFTSFDCLSKNKNAPTGLLREYIRDYKVNL